MKEEKKKRLPSVKTARNRCDGMLTPIIKAMHPFCLLCPQRTQVAHHHVHKSKSTRLRYEISNLINLCNSCHLALHMNESYWASRIVDIRGIEWFRELDRKKDECVKADVHYYIENAARLKDIMESLELSTGIL